jgi:hypothetical protein
MSSVIGTRNSVQAKTHHQKLEEKYQTTSNIIQQLGFILKKIFIFEEKSNEK